MTKDAETTPTTTELIERLTYPAVPEGDNFEPTPETMAAQPNNPSRQGRLASKKKFFGPHHRYSVAAVHCRVMPGESKGNVQWFVWDAESETGYGPTVIRQAETVQEAVAEIVAN